MTILIVACAASTFLLGLACGVIFEEMNLRKRENRLAADRRQVREMEAGLSREARQRTA